MEDINYFKDFIESTHDYRKILNLCFNIKRDDTTLREIDLSDDFIEKLYNDCKQIMYSDMNDYFKQVKNLEGSILENNS